MKLPFKTMRLSIADTTALEFKPYEKERDHLGRLISKNVFDFNSLTATNQAGYSTIFS